MLQYGKDIVLSFADFIMFFHSNSHAHHSCNSHAHAHHTHNISTVILSGFQVSVILDNFSII